jgi:hypothetical protein
MTILDAIKTVDRRAAYASYAGQRQWIIMRYDLAREIWVESSPTSYGVARSIARAANIDAVLDLVGIEPRAIYPAGGWRSVVRAVTRA